MSVRVSLIGAAYSANKGAASMVQAIVDHLPERQQDVEIDVLSTYPDADAAALERSSSPARAVSCRPVELAMVLFPLAVLIAALRTARLPWGWLCMRPALRSVRAADLVIDVSGISFSDSRRLRFTIYGAILNSVPILLGTPQVKASQAMGSFRGPVNRALARMVLPRMASIAARGDRTAEHLDELGVPYTAAADLAFLMRVPPAAEDRADALVTSSNGVDGCRWVALAPSAVVDGFCTDNGIDYIGALANFVDEIVGDDRVHVVLVAHSSSSADVPTRLDDLPVCRAIYGRVRAKDRCELIDDDLLATELRAIIARCDLLITSRFHAMVSALATGTPTVVVGWSHKYAEVLSQFSQYDVVIDYVDLGDGGLTARYHRVVQELDERRAQVQAGLPAVLSSARVNLEEIDRVLGTVPGSSAAVRRSPLDETSSG